MQIYKKKLRLLYSAAVIFIFLMGEYAYFFFLRVGEGDEVVAVKFFGAFDECSREKPGVKIFYQRAIYSLF